MTAALPSDMMGIMRPAPSRPALIGRRPAMTSTAPVPDCPVDDSFDPLSPEFLADPYAVMSALALDGTPVFFAPSIGYYVITRYADIEAVFGDPAAYSAAAAQAPLVPLVAVAQRILLAGGHQPAPTMVSLDEPDHARLRKPDRHHHHRVPRLHPRPGGRQGPRARR
jgi:cytochrome P450